MKRLSLIAMLSILAAILLAMVAWLASPWLLQRLAAARLSALGYDDVLIEASRPTAKGVRLERFALGDSSTGIALTLTDVDVSFRLADLVRGRLLGARVGKMSVMTSGAPSGGAVTLPAALPALPFRDWLARVPERGITVERVLVSDAEGRRLLPTFTLRLGGDERAAELVAIPVATADRVLRIVFDHAGRVEGALAWIDDAHEAALEMRIDGLDSGSEWRAWAKTDIARLKTWLDPLVDVDWPVSSCVFVAQVRLDENPLDAVGANIDASDCDVADMRFAGAALGGRFMRTDRGIASVAPVRLSLRDWSMASQSIRTVSVDSGMDVDFEAGSIALPVGARIRAAGIDAGIDGFSIADIDATLASTLAGGATGVDGPAVLDASQASMVWQGSSARLSRTRIRIRFEGFAATAIDASIADLGIDNGEFGARIVDADLNVASRGSRVEGRLAGRLADVMPVRATLRADADFASGSLRIEGDPVTLGEGSESASRLIDGWPAGMDLVAGALGFSVDGSWDASATVIEADVSFDAVGGMVEGVYFSDATTTLELELVPALATRRAADFSIAVVDYGVSLRDVGGTLEIDGTEDREAAIVVTGLTAHAFGGTLAVGRLTPAVAGKFELVLSGVDLAEIAGREAFPGLRIEGRVDGRVPVEIKPEGLYINGGAIESSGGGIIQYDGGDASAGSGADILFRALKDFEYTVLTAQPAYRPDGTLVLAVHLEGSSEEIGRNQPIHLNVNVEQNLLSLLESIRLVNGLNDRIDQRVQQFYEKRSD